VNTITYEQPLNERIRSFLRLEHLFRFLSFHMSGHSEWDNRSAISDMINIVDLIGRSDIKMDLIKELERHLATLENLKNNKNVDLLKLDDVLKSIISISSILKDASCQPGQTIRQDDFLSSIKQRSLMPGGSCNFDLPGYHYWLHLPEEQRSADLSLWFKDLEILSEAVKLVLTLVRNSANPTGEVAQDGFFQKPIESGQSCQMVRVIMPADSDCYPEISGGRHRFTVRFMQQMSNEPRPTQFKDDVEFELHCCIL